ncbi:MAG TPA: hypothetical protein PLF54_13385, partial [Deltaproteobacteria bacterium]|nr:hypothetical protein [Deltaproteobacteria bacterium]
DLVIGRPRVVGVYVMLTMVESAMTLASEIRRNIPDVLLVCGGPLPTVRPERFMRDFDVAFRGEASRSFPKFCRDYIAHPSIRDIFRRHELYPGLYAVDPSNGMLIQTPVQAMDEEGLDRLPIPDRRDFRHVLYQKAWQEREGFSPACIMTTYGCPHQCEFCSKPVFGRYYRKRAWTASWRRYAASGPSGMTGCGSGTTASPSTQATSGLSAGG